MQTRISKRENGSVAHRILLDERLAKRKMLNLLREIEGLNTELNRLSAMADRLDLYDLKKRIDSATQCAADTVARMRRGISSI